VESLVIKIEGVTDVPFNLALNRQVEREILPRVNVEKEHAK
jgi:hypothetical protein